MVKVTEDEIRERVKARLRDMKLSQAELARRMNLSDGWASSYLNGTNGVPLDTLLDIADKLEMDVCELLVGRPFVVEAKQAENEMFREVVYGLFEQLPPKDRVDWIKRLSVAVDALSAETAQDAIDRNGTQSGAS